MTGSEIANWIIAIVGNIFIVVVVVRLLQGWMKDEWGKIVSVLAGAVLVGACIYFPDQFKSFLGAIWNLFTGGGAAA